jgi:hypothetical protein
MRICSWSGSLVATAVFLANAAAQPARSPEELKRMEKIVSAPPIATGWRPGGIGAIDGSSRVGVDHQDRHGGQASGFIRAVRETNNTYLLQGIRPIALRGKRVRVSAFLRTEGVTDSPNSYDSRARLFVEVIEPNNGRSSWDQMVGREVRGTTEWQQYTIVIDVSRTAVYMVYGLKLSGNGTAWIDDVSVEVVGLGTQVTAPPNGDKESPAWPPTDAVRRMWAAAPANPVNLDFEQ